MQLHSGDQVEFVQISENQFELIAISHDIQPLKGIVKSKD